MTSPITCNAAAVAERRRAVIDNSFSSYTTNTFTQRDSSLAPGSARAGDFVCRTTGVCTPCPASEVSFSFHSTNRVCHALHHKLTLHPLSYPQLGSPVCKIFGNRKSLTCVRVADSTNYSGAGFARGTPASSPPPPPLPPRPDDSMADLGTHPRLDPDPQNLDDEALQDQLRAGAAAALAANRGLPLAQRDALVSRSLTNRQQQQHVPIGSEIFTWEACARVVQKERADFFEFVVGP